METEPWNPSEEPWEVWNDRKKWLEKEAALPPCSMALSAAISVSYPKPKKPVNS